ncbi:hypothetical protein ACX1C1_20355 [Paenibacillus sp. strain BS8-2]
MELIKEIYELELGISEQHAASIRHGGQFWFSRMAVGILYNEAYEILLIQMDDGQITLPICPIQSQQNIGQALVQACISAASTEEEAQSFESMKISEHQDLGLVIEYLDKAESMRFAYGYTARAYIKKSRMNEDQAGTLSGLVWMTPQEAYAKINRYEPTNYEEKFDRARNLAFIQHLLQLR